MILLAEERDAQIAVLLREAIARAKSRVEQYGWKPKDTAWHRAFGEIAAYYSILQLIDANPGARPTVETLSPAQSGGEA